jgi:hypothetical protein
MTFRGRFSLKPLKCTGKLYPLFLLCKEAFPTLGKNVKEISKGWKILVILVA